MEGYDWPRAVQPLLPLPSNNETPSPMTGLLRDVAVGLGLAVHWCRKRSTTGRWPTGVGARNGRVGPVERRTPGPRVLVHGVSVGETHALEPLTEALAASPLEPDLVASASTETGFARAVEVHGVARAVVRFPLDFTWTVRRFLDAVRPRVVVLAELELWPSFLGACARRGIPVCVVNGRLSDRSLRGYRAGRALAGRMFRGLALVATQTEADRDRFVSMGVPPARCVTTGNLKWDAARKRPSVRAAETLASALGIDRTRPLVVAGSTGPGEETRLLRGLPAGCQLLLAPRNPDRWDEVAALVPGMRRRSRVSGQERADGADRPARTGLSAAGAHPSASDVFLLDTLGELPAAYSLASAVFVGRSLAALGGSNPIEPAALGKPTVTGPRCENFRGVVDDLLEEGGIVVSEDPMAVIERWTADPKAAEAVAAGGLRAADQRSGSARRTAELVLRLVGRQSGATGSGRGASVAS